MKKKIVALLMAVTMCMGVVAGCGSKESSDKGADKGKDDAAVADEGATDAETVELKWYVPGNAVQADVGTVEKAVNEYLKGKLNVTLKLIMADFGSFDQKMQMAISSQEEFDICYTSSWMNNIYNNINKNAFLELNDLIDEYAPKTKELLPETGWGAATVKGNIYAIPNYQIWARQDCAYFVKEYVDKYNFDMSAVKNIRDLEPLLEQIKQDNPDVYVIENCKQSVLNWLSGQYGYDEIVGRFIPGVVMLDDEELKVINQFELPEIQDHFKLMREWSQKGYFRPDSATLNDVEADKKSGALAMTFAGTMKPGDEANMIKRMGDRDVVACTFSEPILTTSGINATMTAISRTSKNPELAMQFLELVNTDPVLYNLICFGVEGTHYTMDDKKQVVAIENSGYDPNVDWAFGNQFNGYLRAGQEEGIWEATAALNEAGRPSPALGFVFNPEKVQTEIASVSAVVAEYALMLDTGSVDPTEKMPEFLEKLEQAGSQVIIDEAQKQLDEWKVSK